MRPDPGSSLWDVYRGEVWLASLDFETASEWLEGLAERDRLREFIQNLDDWHTHDPESMTAAAVAGCARAVLKPVNPRYRDLRL